MRTITVGRNTTVVAVSAILWMLATGLAVAHCDTLDGPVVVTAKDALENGDVTPVLKWVRPEHEQEIRATFDKTLAVRDKGPDVQELVDMYFFETLVRLHREGEGAPYTGLKPAGNELESAVLSADKSLDSGSVDPLVKLITGDAAAGIRERFAETLERKKHANDSVEAGRKYVAAYVEFVHYVERLHLDAAGHNAHHSEASGEPREAAAQHRHE